MKIYPGWSMGLAKRVMLTALAAFMIYGVSVAREQNLTSKDEAAAQKIIKDAADKASDEAFAKALPIIHQWEAKGLPYTPWAALPADLPPATIPAFPGAQGGGMYSHGGRGGKVIVVTNLNDSGPGSFREAVEQGGPRIVIFNVAGIIKLQSHVRIRAPYITIAGNTAPGDGVCIAGNTVEIETHDVVVRYMRFRRGVTSVADRDDAFGGNPVGNIMIDHVSASWGLDEDMSMYRHMYQPPANANGKLPTALKLPTVNITFQNCISSEALNPYNHAFGGTIGGLNSTFFRNLYACNVGRNPSVGMIGDFTFANNVLFNWFERTVDGGDERSFFNIINNYYKPGPVTPKDKPIAYRILKPESRRTKELVDDFGKAYVDGNVVEGNDTVTANNWAGGVQVEGTHTDPAILLRDIRAGEPYPHANFDILPASQTFDYVLNHAGATLPKRDPVDERVIQMARTGVVTYKDGIITDPEQVGGYPEYKGEPYKSSMNDGFPDAWKIKYGLMPNEPLDPNGDMNGDGYTNIEKFIYGLDPTAPKTNWHDPKNHVDPLEKAVAMPAKS